MTQWTVDGSEAQSFYGDSGEVGLPPAIEQAVLARHLAGQVQKAEREMNAPETPDHLWWKEFGRQDAALRLTAELLLWPQVKAILDKTEERI